MPPIEQDQRLRKQSEVAEMRIHAPRLKLRRRRATGSADDLILLRVWGLAFGRDVHHSAAYTDYCTTLLGFLEGHSSTQVDRNDIIDLVEVVGANRDQPIARIKDAIRQAHLKWMIPATDDDSALAALDFVVRLWLFIEPSLEDATWTLSKVVFAALPERAAFQQNSSYLTRDFCAKSLTRKGGIKIEWTSYLAEHLSLVGKSRLRVFRHVSALQKYARSTER